MLSRDDVRTVDLENGRVVRSEKMDAVKSLAIAADGLVLRKRESGERDLFAWTAEAGFEPRGHLEGLGPIQRDELIAMSDDGTVVALVVNGELNVCRIEWETVPRTQEQWYSAAGPFFAEFLETHAGRTHKGDRAELDGFCRRLAGAGMANSDFAGIEARLEAAAASWPPRARKIQVRPGRALEKALRGGQPISLGVAFAIGGPLFLALAPMREVPLVLGVLFDGFWLALGAVFIWKGLKQRRPRHKL